MEQANLERWIGDGLSLEEIARRVGRHPSTVSYWMEKYGLRPAYAEKHAARGALGRDQLCELIERGLSVRQMAEELGRSATTVKHWLRRHGLETAQSTRRRIFAEARASNALRVMALCSRHGETLFRLRPDQTSYACMRCRSESVSELRRRRKARLVMEAGGACALCGYSRYPGPCSFTISTARPSSSRSPIAVCADPSSARRPRWRSASCSAQPVTPRSREDSASWWPKMMALPAD
jgi:transposase